MSRKNMYVATGLAVVVVAYFVITGAFGYPFFISQPTQEDSMTQTDVVTGVQAGEFLSAIKETGSVSELKILDTIVGEGEGAVAGDMITVNYTGMLPDGTIFDSSTKEGRDPFSFKLGSGMVIQGWEKGIVGMKVGGKRLLAIPASMAYGERGQGPIPPNATLIFTVEMLDIQK